MNYSYKQENMAVYLKASSFDETDLVVLIENVKARDFLGELHNTLNKLVESLLKALPTVVGVGVIL